MNELSNDLNVITAQIHLIEEELDRTMNERAYQIGQLLYHVKENLKHGQFTEWIETNFKFSRRYSYHFLNYFQQNQNVKSTSQLPSFTKEVEIMSLPEPKREEMRDAHHVVPSTGEEKHFDDLTQKELREVKKAFKEKEEEAAKAWSEATQWKKAAQSQPTRTIEVESPALKKKVEQLDFENRTLKAGYQEATDKLKAVELRDPVEFDAEEAQKQREKLQHEADLTTLNIRVAFKQFIEKAAISSFMQGAIATASGSEKERLAELVESAQQIIDQTQLALRGRKLGVINEQAIS